MMNIRFHNTRTRQKEHEILCWRLLDILILAERPRWPDHNALFRSQIGPQEPSQNVYKVFHIFNQKFSLLLFSLLIFFLRTILLTRQHRTNQVDLRQQKVYLTRANTSSDYNDCCIFRPAIFMQKTKKCKKKFVFLMLLPATIDLYCYQALSQLCMLPYASFG